MQRQSFLFHFDFYYSGIELTIGKYKPTFRGQDYHFHYIQLNNLALVLEQCLKARVIAAIKFSSDPSADFEQQKKTIGLIFRRLQQERFISSIEFQNFYPINQFLNHIFTFDLKFITILQIDQCPLSDQGVLTIVGMSLQYLKTISLDINKVSNRGMKIFCKGKWPRLTTMTLQRRQFVGDELAYLGKMAVFPVKLNLRFKQFFGKGAIKKLIKLPIPQIELLWFMVVLRLSNMKQYVYFSSEHLEKTLTRVSFSNIRNLANDLGVLMWFKRLDYESVFH